MTGRPPSTIRDWLKKGIIHGEQDPKGRWSLDRVTVVAAAATAPTAARAVASQLQQPSAALTSAAVAAEPTVARYIDSLQETVAREREENKELRGRIRELEQERTQHLAEMRALLSRDSGGKENVLSRWIRR
jgi:vacuolar-type H+-ATPase subunit I/STV1